MYYKTWLSYFLFKKNKDIIDEGLSRLKLLETCDFNLVNENNNSNKTVTVYYKTIVDYIDILSKLENSLNNNINVLNIIDDLYISEVKIWNFFLNRNGHYLNMTSVQEAFIIQTKSYLQCCKTLQNKKDKTHADNINLARVSKITQNVILLIETLLRLLKERPWNKR